MSECLILPFMEPIFSYSGGNRRYLQGSFLELPVWIITAVLNYLASSRGVIFAASAGTKSSKIHEKHRASWAIWSHSTGTIITGYALGII
jgi:hypothetical protein